MIIHIWMHWFWITTVYFNGFQVLSISLSSSPSLQEAGLLSNATLTPITPDSYNGNHSSQTENGANVTVTKLSSVPPPPPPPSSVTTPHQLVSSPREETITEESTTTAKPADVPRSAFGPTSDAEDIYTGGTVDVFQYPLKKFTKYSHLKYGKVKAKGKTGEDTEDRKTETVKVVEEKVNINISITGDGDGRSQPETDNEGGNTSEVLTSDAPDLITTTFAVENVTSSEDLANETYENVSPTNGTGDFPSTETADVLMAPTGNQKEVELLKNETLVIESKVEESRTFTTVEPFVVRNRVAAATSAQNYEVEQPEMNAGSITGITLGILVVFSLFGAVSFVLYRRRYLNKPQVLHDKCSNLDSSGYIDETSLKENSEEMYSLDNDSFLNSLEAMTIQNYWTENVKHTKL